MSGAKDSTPGSVHDQTVAGDVATVHRALSLCYLNSFADKEWKIFRGAPLAFDRLVRRLKEIEGDRDEAKQRLRECLIDRSRIGHELETAVAISRNEKPKGRNNE